jgi:hypothetical protein
VHIHHISLLGEVNAMAKCHMIVIFDRALRFALGFIASESLSKDIARIYLFRGLTLAIDLNDRRFPRDLVLRLRLVSAMNLALQRWRNPAHATRLLFVRVHTQCIFVDADCT